MGKPTGFIEYKRQIPNDRDPQNRINDWNEIHLHLNEEESRQQGARCMDCGVPFCHTGHVVNGMASGCPVSNLIPEWNDLIYRGLWKEAYERLAKTNNFPEFTGRVCPAPCEGSCVLGINEPPVTIKNNEVTIIERAFQENWVHSNKPIINSQKKVAVVGSGPAGLACADELCKKGHQVTVYERADRIGGLLMYGIPNMKLEKHIVKRRIQLMKDSGITFKTSVEIGKDISAKQLQINYDSVVLCCGATKPRDLPIEGRDLKGVHFAMDFLTQNTKSLLDSTHNDNQYINAKGKNVIVIGGGDTGTDCVGTSIRHGCKSVKQLEIMGKPPLTRDKSNPWPEWPKVYFMDYGQEEAAAKFGGDPREYNTMTQKFVGDSNGDLKELHIVTIKWNFESGSPVPNEIPGTEQVLSADLVLLAMGFLGPEETIPHELNLEQDTRSNVKAEYGKYTTNVKGVFAAGDMRRGQSLIVWAINEGRGVAEACHNYVMQKQHNL